MSPSTSRKTRQRRAHHGTGVLRAVSPTSLSDGEHIHARNHTNGPVLRDAAIIILSVAVAVVLARTDAMAEILGSTGEWGWLGSALAGMFFTSIFTTAPAMVVLGEIAQTNALLPTAVFGAIGATAGDAVIFRFVRDRFSGYILKLLKRPQPGSRIKALFKMRYFRWLSFFVGGLVIASPLPDELGVGLWGFSKMNVRLFVLLSFSFNFLGILLVGIVARAL